jgi:hypothetical protein
MAFIQETIKHEIAEAELEVLQRDPTWETYWDAWQIIYISIPSSSRVSPEELIKLGEWFIEQGKRIKKEYTSTGRPKKQSCKSPQS